MSRTFFLAASAALLLTSACNRVDHTSTGQTPPASYYAIADIPTRGTAASA